MKIELVGVSKTFGRGTRERVAVDNVSWSAAPGEVVGLLGPNGAGKTTMIRMLLDIMRPDKGEILIDGDKGANRTMPFKARTGYLPEERGLYQRRRVEDILWYLGALKGLDRADALKRGAALLERLGLVGWRGKRINELSKGMGQKVQIACSLLHDPELVVLDEPFSGLDPLNVRIVRQLVLDLKREGKVVLLSTHLMAEVEALCDRIFMIHRGQQVIEGVVHELQRRHSPFDAMVDGAVDCGDLACVAELQRIADMQYLKLTPGSTLATLMSELGQKDRPVRLLREATTPLEELFVTLISQRETP
jgi:ABC-2 type transport system ATP-binding protein